MRSPEVERADLAQRFAERGDRALEQLLAQLGGGPRRVADVAVVEEVVGQPAEADLAAELDVTVADHPLGDAPLGLGHVAQVRGEVEHHAGLVGAAVHAHAVLVLGRRTTLVGGHTRMGEEGHQPMVEADLPVGGAEQCAVAAVAVEEHEPLGGRLGDAPADVVEHGQQGRRRQPDRSGRPRVLVRLGVGERW